MAYRRSAETYDHCAYLNCYNGKHSTGHRLFRFPRYGDSRHRLWLRNAGIRLLVTFQHLRLHAKVYSFLCLCKHGKKKHANSNLRIAASSILFIQTAKLPFIILHFLIPQYRLWRSTLTNFWLSQPESFFIPEFHFMFYKFSFAIRSIL